MASTDFLYLAAYFVFPMLKVWLSSPSTFVEDYFLIGPTALVGLRYFMAPSILGLTSDISFSFSFPVCTTGVFRQGKPARLTLEREVHGPFN